MNQKESNIKNFLIYGIHGAAGILMGIGIGAIISYFLFGFILSMIVNYQIFMEYPVLSRLLQPPVFMYVFAFAIYGAYIGYIFEGKEKAIHLSISGAIAGVLCGIADAGYVELTQITGETGQLVFFPVILAVTGLILGVPKVRTMTLLAISGALGGAAGYGMYLLGLNLKFYLIYLKFGLPVIFLTILLLLLAVGIPGAFIAIGMYFTEITTSVPLEIPRFLRITRNIGVVLTVLLLSVSTLLSSGMSNYGSTSSSIQISSNSGGVALYVPVFLDDKGKVLEMYERPTVRGAAATAIIDTEHGKALKITGNGRIELNMEQTHVRFIRGDSQRFFEGLKLSMNSYAQSESLKGNQIDAWIYSDVEGALINYNIKQDSGGGRIMDIHTDKTERLNRGWQVVRLSVTSMMYD